MTAILISGMPGCGKTTIARDVCCALGIEELIQTDTLKTVRKMLGHTDVSVATSHDAWKLVSNSTQFGLFEGYCAHIRSYASWIRDIARISYESGKHIIIEGVQAGPDAYCTIDTPHIGFYLTCNSFTRRDRLIEKQQRRFAQTTDWIKNFNIICAIDKQAVVYAPQKGMCVIDNGYREWTVKTIVSEVKNEFGKSA